MLVLSISAQSVSAGSDALYGAFALLGIVAMGALAWGVWRYNAGGATVKALQELTDAQERVNTQLRTELAEAKQQIISLQTDLQVLQRQVSGADAVIRMEKSMHEQHLGLMRELTALVEAVNRVAKS